MPNGTTGSVFAGTGADGRHAQHPPKTKASLVILGARLLQHQATEIEDLAETLRRSWLSRQTQK